MAVVERIADHKLAVNCNEDEAYDMAGQSLMNFAVSISIFSSHSSKALTLCIGPSQAAQLQEGAKCTSALDWIETFDLLLDSELTNLEKL